MKTKREMREAAIKRLKEHRSFPDYYRELIKTIVGDDLDELTSDECIGRIIDLLTDDESYEDDAYTMGPRDADGIFWFRGDMSDSPWGVIEGVVYDCTRREWLVRGHDISAPWVPAGSIRHAPMRTATQREDDLIRLIKDAARDYESLQADCRGMSDLKDTCWQKFKDLHEAVDVRYIELPVDANGEPWHVGDVTENGNVVMGMAIDNTGEWYFINTRNDIDPLAHYHYHKPTVEDVLREFAIACEDTGNAGPEVQRLAGEYAKKLQLKEDE